MGEAEDTFTKQEIQAGYVTSGRDVLARQQQIVAQALSAASGAAGAGTRRKVGGGGPSGTGKASSNPVFPPPCYDEPQKAPAASLVPPPASVTRSTSVGTAGVASSSLPAGPAGKVNRSVTVGAPPVSAIGAQARKGANGVAVPPNRPPCAVGPAGATAASVVAGVHSFSNPSAPTVEGGLFGGTATPFAPFLA